MVAPPLPLTGGDPYKNTNRISFSIIVIALQHSRTIYTNKQTSVKKAFARQIQTNLNPNPIFPKCLFLNNVPEVDPVGTPMGGTLLFLFPNRRFQKDFLLVEAVGTAGGPGRAATETQGHRCVTWTSQRHWSTSLVTVAGQRHLDGSTSLVNISGTG